MSKFIPIVQMINGIRTSSQDHSTSRWWGIARVAWYVAAVLTLVMVIMAIPGYIQSVPEGFSVIPFAANPSPVVVAINALTVLLSLATVLLSIYLAFLLFRHRSKDRMALFLSFYLLAFAAYSVPLEQLESVATITNVPSIVWNGIFTPLIMFPASCFLFLLFPDGRFAPVWSRRVAMASLITSPMMVISFLIWSRSDTRPLGAMVIGGLLTVTVMVGVLYAQIYRYRHLATGPQRHQIKWVVYGLGLMLFLLVVSAYPYYWSFTLPADTPYPFWLAFSTALYFLAFAVFPVSLTIAVMRHRLYDIDILINRTLVYGALTACIVGLYVLIVGGVSTAILASSKSAGFLLATVLVVVLFQPIRTILQRGVDRMLTKEDKDVPRSDAIDPSDSTNGHEIDSVYVSLTNPWLRLARFGWYLVAALALVIFVAIIPGLLLAGSSSITDIRFSSNSSPLLPFFSWFRVAGVLATGLISLLLAGLLFRRRLKDRMALFTSYFLLAYWIIAVVPYEALKPLFPEVLNIIQIFPLPGSMLPFFLLLFALFPDGGFVPRWTRWVVVATFLITPFSLFWISQYMDSQLDFSRPAVLIPLGVNLILATTIWLSILYAQIYRYRTISTHEQKQQTKVVLYGISVWIALQMILAIPWFYSYALPTAGPAPLWLMASSIPWIISIAIIPVTLTIAVMRYRLYDIDIIINRTMVYGVLTASTMGIYVFIVGYLGYLFQDQNSSIIAFLTTGLVALLFQPLRDRLQSAVNHLMYGERSDPVSVLSKLGKQLEETPSPHEALNEMVATIAQALKLPYVAIVFGKGDNAQLVSAFGQTPGEAVKFPIGYQGQDIGSMLVAPRSPGKSFGEKDKILLENIALQAGAAAQAAKLTADLRHSRQGLVTAREEERRRLRRDLHDGIGPTMAGQTLKIDAAIDLILGDPESGQKPDPEEAIKMLTEVKQQTQKTVRQVRQIVYALRPPSLDDLGLVAAIQTHISQLSVSRYGLDISLETSPQDLPRLSAAVEVATYRIVLEALTNVINHAQARECVVKLSVPEYETRTLYIEIKDDGKGLPKEKTAGVGLTSMRERVEELGGSFAIESDQTRGTRILAQIPLFSIES